MRKTTEHMYTATDCNRLQHTATYCNALPEKDDGLHGLRAHRHYCNTLQRAPTCCNILQHPTTANTLQQPATQNLRKMTEHTDPVHTHTSAKHCNIIHDQDDGAHRLRAKTLQNPAIPRNTLQQHTTPPSNTIPEKDDGVHGPTAQKPAATLCTDCSNSPAQALFVGNPLAL